MPIFRNLVKEFAIEQPFKDLNIIIAHVLVPNTLPLIATVKDGGAKVTIIPSSPAINQNAVKILQEVGCKVEYSLKSAKGFDYAMDVGGIFSENLPRYGVIEVTRSGVHKYLPKKDKTVIISADDSKCKLIETFIGNPQSTLLGIRRFIGEPEVILHNKTIAVLGFGKIGRGITRLFSKYCHVLVCDISENALTKAKELGFDTLKIIDDKKRNYESVNQVDYVISCTGFADVVSKYFTKLNHPTLINLGNFDEFGSDYIEKEIFMSKDRPFNFNNDPPTANKYIDPILASETLALRYLIENKLENGLYTLPKKIDEELVVQFQKYQNESLEDLDFYF